jgi:hypothetical protein
MVNIAMVNIAIVNFAIVNIAKKSKAIDGGKKSYSETGISKILLHRDELGCCFLI